MGDFRHYLKSQIAKLAALENRGRGLTDNDVILPLLAKTFNEQTKIFNQIRARALTDGYPQIARMIDAIPETEPIKRQHEAVSGCLALVTPPSESEASTPLTVAQAAKQMNISQRKVYDLCKKGLLRHTTNPIRIRPADIEAFQARQRDPSPVALRHLR
ncbi:MAG TPA: helix-turn-helix domain-containing protein [Pirellulales bacterium]|nr:helix-turn-helix domain-containing protein [Pirellulales bacterium]